MRKSLGKGHKDKQTNKNQNQTDLFPIESDLSFRFFMISTPVVWKPTPGLDREENKNIYDEITLRRYV